MPIPPPDPANDPIACARKGGHEWGAALEITPGVYRRVARCCGLAAVRRSGSWSRESINPSE